MTAPTDQPESSTAAAPLVPIPTWIPEPMEQTIAELARHNQELSLALSAAERRVKEAEATQQSLLAVSEQYVLEIRELETKLDHALELMNDQTTGSFYVLAEVDRLKTENQILQRTAELQLALVTATADVVEAARKVRSAAESMQRCRETETNSEVWRHAVTQGSDATAALYQALTALDQASPPLASGRPRTGYSGTYEDLGDVELSPEEHAEAERQQRSIDVQAIRGPVSPIGPSETATASTETKNPTWQPGPFCASACTPDSHVDTRPDWHNAMSGYPERTRKGPHD